MSGNAKTPKPALLWYNLELMSLVQSTYMATLNRLCTQHGVDTQKQMVDAAGMMFYVCIVALYEEITEAGGLHTADERTVATRAVWIVGRDALFLPLYKHVSSMVEARDGVGLPNDPIIRLQSVRDPNVNTLVPVSCL